MLHAAKILHDDDEIVEAVIHSTTAGCQLKAFLESIDTEDLTLKTMIDTLQSYYIAADVKDLMQDLTTLKQKSNEDAHKFVMRGLMVMNQIVKKSKASKKKRISKSMAKEMLLDSLESGLSSESIRVRMRPYLQDPSISKSELLAAASRALKSERDRKGKFERSTARVNELDCADDAEKEEVKFSEACLAELKGIRSDYAEVKADVALVSGELSKLRQPNNNKDGKSQYGCKDCKAKGINDKCNHCFKCGKTDHKSYDCPEKNQNQSNLNRSPPRT